MGHASLGNAEDAITLEITLKGQTSFCFKA